MSSCQRSTRMFFVRSEGFPCDPGNPPHQHDGKPHAAMALSALLIANGGHLEVDIFTVEKFSGLNFGLETNCGEREK